MSRKAPIPADKQKLIVARVLSGEPATQVAADLQVPLTTVYWYTKTARKKVIKSDRDFTEAIGDAFEGNLLAQQAMTALFSDREWLERIELDRLREIRTTYGVLADKGFWFLAAATGGGATPTDGQSGPVPVGPGREQGSPARVRGFIEAPTLEDVGDGEEGDREELEDLA